MVMLSAFLRFRLADEHKQTAKLVDVALDLAAGDYPPVARLLVRGRTRQSTLEWDQVVRIDWRRRGIVVRDLTAGRAAPPAALMRTVLAKRDIMDALIVDVAHRETMRANDLWLREDHEHLWLAAADTSPWAIIRRLARGILGRGRDRRLADWRDLEFLRGDPAAASAGQDYHHRMTRLQPPEIARLLDALPYPHAAEALTLIPDPLAADVLEAMQLERQAQLVATLAEEQTVRLLALMAPERATDLLGRLNAERAQHLLLQVPDQPRSLMVDLLRYPDDTAGGIMTNQLVCVPVSMPVGDVRREFKQSTSTPDFASYLYIIDGDETRHLEGVVSLRDFAFAEDSQLIGDLMHDEVVTVDALESAEVAARRVAEQHLAALPVTGRDGRLLGAITVDAAMAQIAPPAWLAQAPRVFS